jgi:ketosteroid isomerase-like protein
MSGKPAEMIRDIYGAISSRNFDTATSYFAEEVVLVVHGDVSTETGTFKGREEVGGWFGRWYGAFAQGYQMKVEDIRELGDRVFVVQRHEGQGRTSGVPVEMRNAALISLRGGKITRIEIYRDPDEALEAAGVA